MPKTLLLLVVEESKMKLMEGRSRLCKASSGRSGDDHDDVPSFGIADFDSPSPVQMKASNFDLEGSAEVFAKGEDDDSENRNALQEPYFSGINYFKFDPAVKEKPLAIDIEGKFYSRNYVDCEVHRGCPIDIPETLGTTTSNSHLEKKKQLKIKMAGRRRLCKVSSKVNKDDHLKSVTANDDAVFAGLVDYDSPPPLKNAVERDSGGGNEIRDILNDLSSRLEYLSIEKKRPLKKVDPKQESVLIEDEACSQEMGEDLPEFASAASSLASDPSNSSFDAITQSGSGHSSVRGLDEYQEKFDLENELDCAADDCEILSDQKMVEDMESQHGQFQESYDNSDIVNIVDDHSDDSISEDDIITLKGPKATYVLPGNIAKMLYPHQRDGLKWLWSLHCQSKGGILGDDMGLGKTMQICGFLSGLFHSRLIKRALVVAPKTLIPHWIKELSVVGLSEKTREYFGTCIKTRQYELQYVLQDKGVLLTTYDIVRNNVKSLRGDNYLHNVRNEDDMTWDYMILDEGHLIKNPGTQRAKSLLEIPSAHRIIISGTPIQNNLKELWALFNFCYPELLGEKNWFKEKYESAILRGNEKNASDREKRIGSTAAKELRERIQPYFLRRLKSEVFDENDTTKTAKLSKKNEIIVWLRLTRCQRQLYEAFLKSELVLSAFDGSPLAALTILKKICDHPLLLTKRAAEDVLEGMDSMLNQEDNVIAEKLAMHIADVTEGSHFEEEHDNVSCKISFILLLLDKLISEGHHVLIFSQTRKMLNLIQESLAAKGYNFLRIDGTTKASERVKIVDDFQEGIGAPIFLLTAQVGGLGLTLTKADRVIVVDPAWNPSTDSQSVDRAYRIGQKKDVVVYRLMTCGTIEEKIYRKQIFKGGLFKTATEHKEQTRYFSQQDLQELFSLPKQGFDVSLTQQQLHEEHDHQHKMDEYLEAHVKFLESRGIAGVSHHSLLFSKTAPVPSVQDDEELKRVKGTTFNWKPSPSSQLKYGVDGAMYAFKPKDAQVHKNSNSTGSPSERTESEIRERINRLAGILANKVMISKLPDKGGNIHKQISELNSELNMIQMEKRKEKEVIDVDDIAGDLQRVVLNV
ncbi:protein CHROMATIN REMODELING 24 isoform X2 [Diospyros lotus]|uniref:protein CHROMATIN REMODELING 24 isoform X2 n=1 Tax=Diospyros lotus TaxID=55363 RepID=UPI00225498AA|nr:protein CHROMATIN REMODELING 24 isoform X2 [Diospyros lotus]